MKTLKSKELMKLLKQENIISKVKILLNVCNSSLMMQKKWLVNLNRTDWGKDSL